MERPQDSCTEVLDRVAHVLPVVFHAFGISEARAQAIVENACRTLASKRRLKLQNPEGWLLRTIIDACRRSAEEERVEDPSA
jgi:hypothetical protein